ncbi:19366_t:CDS:1, partial [Gigaspora rosea]
AHDAQSSQIDDIWISNEIILDFECPTLVSPAGITDSNHQIIQMTWCTNLYTKPRRKQKAKRKIYLYDKTSEEAWDELRKFVTAELQTRWAFTNAILDEETLNKKWNI